jgi:hypothetical protein
MFPGASPRMKIIVKGGFDKLNHRSVIPWLDRGIYYLINE